MPGNHNGTLADLIPSKTNGNCWRGITLSANSTFLSPSTLFTACKNDTLQSTLSIDYQIEEMLDSVQGEFEFKNDAQIISYLLVNT